MKSVVYILLILGAFFISIDMVGKSRALKWENSFKNFSIECEHVYNEFFFTFLNSSKKIPSDVRRQLPWPDSIINITRLTFPLQLAISIFSCFIMYLAVQDFGIIKMFALMVGSWIVLIAFFGLYIISFENLVVPFPSSAILNSVFNFIWMLFHFGMLLIFTAMILTVSLLSLWPLCLIIGLYVIIFLVSTAAVQLIVWKETLELGNVFMIIGFVLTVTALFIQWIKGVE